MVASGLPIEFPSTDTVFFPHRTKSRPSLRAALIVLERQSLTSLSLSLFKPPGDGRHGPASVQSVPPSAHTKVFEEDGGGREPRRQVWGGEELSPERFPSPNVIYPLPRNCRLSPTRMVTRSRSKYSRRGMTYLRERPPDSSLNPAGSRSSCEANHACIRPLSS